MGKKREILSFYKDICEDDAKVRIINKEIEQLCQE